MTPSEYEAEIMRLQNALKSAHLCARRICLNFGHATEQAEHIMRITREALPPDAFSLLRDDTVEATPR